MRHAFNDREGRITAVNDDRARLIDRYHYTAEWNLGEPEDREPADIEGDLLEPI